jgi:DNA-binding LytR/AlgR family response regulator
MEQLSHFFVRKHHTLHRVNLIEVIYFNAEGNYCYVHVEGGRKHAIKISLRQLLMKLPEEIFVRIHKSYIVNINYLTKLDLKERNAYVQDEVLPIGRTFTNELTDRLLVM